jgi:hypothetical protein
LIFSETSCKLNVKCCFLKYQTVRSDNREPVPSLFLNPALVEKQMAIPQAVALGVTGDELGKKIAGSEVSVERTVTSTAIGAGLGAAAAGTLAVAGVAAAAPVVIPLAVATGAVSFIKSLFD